MAEAGTFGYPRERSFTAGPMTFGYPREAPWFTAGAGLGWAIQRTGFCSTTAPRPRETTDANLC